MFVTEVWQKSNSGDKFIGRFTDEQLELWELFFKDDNADYRMFLVN